ncbi:MAG: hypothetical protein ACJA08_002090 [Cyclobacteriaceae bacterium]|jgi:hypothetical protein
MWTQTTELWKLEDSYFTLSEFNDFDCNGLQSLHPFGIDLALIELILEKEPNPEVMILL